MSDDPAERARLVDAIVNGTPIEASASPSDDPTLAEMRVLIEIARVHREALTVDGDAGSTVGAHPPVSVGAATSRWAHLYLFERMSEGSSSIVYRAWDSRLAREVALKLMAGGPSTSETLVEARRLARVRHPHVVSVYGADQVDGRVGVWMELLKGRTLHEAVRTTGPFSAREAALVCADVCSALAAVHSAGLLHRDVKAQNVFREHGGRIVLMDLGAGRDIADETTLDLAGTPLYMAPELFAGASASVRTDIYSLGVLLFFLTTGTVPVVAASLAEIRATHAAGKTRSLRDVRPDLPRAFVEVVDRALAHDPAQRFASAGGMERALTAVVARETGAGEERPTSVVGRALSWRLPAWAALPIAALGGLLVLFSRSLAPDAGPPATSPSRETAAIRSERAVRPLSAYHANIAHAVEELASSLANRGEWKQAAAQYAEAERIYRLNTNADAPLVASALARLAWAQQHDGQLDAARGNYELAIAKFQNFHVTGLQEAAFAALASLHQGAGHYEEAADAIKRALALRQQFASVAGDHSFAWSNTGMKAATLVELMARYPLSEDRDADWLPDLFEAALGMNPRAADGDGNGVSDGDEDVDGDGVSNWLEFGLCVDPSKIVTHDRNVDPEWVGFSQMENRPFEGSPVGSAPTDAAWKIPSNGQSIYLHALTSAQRAAAMSRGWRFTVRGELHQGVGRAALDLSPDGPLFDLGFYRNAVGGTDVRLFTSVVPMAGPLHTISSTSRWPPVGLEYDPLLKRARLFVDRVHLPSESIPGHNQFQERLGFLFAASTGLGIAPRGEVDFQTVRLVIR